MEEHNKQLTLVEPKTRTYNGRVGSGRTEGRQGGVGDGMPTEQFAQRTSVPRTFQGIENTSPEHFSRSTTSEILCKPMEEQNPRLTCGLSAVYQRHEKRSSFLAAD